MRESLTHLERERERERERVWGKRERERVCESLRFCECCEEWGDERGNKKGKGGSVIDGRKLKF